MSTYDDMRDFQMREQYGDSYITPTIAYTGADIDELVHDCGGDTEAAREIMEEVMDRDMARHESERNRQLLNQVAHLQQILNDNGIEWEED